MEIILKAKKQNRLKDKDIYTSLKILISLINEVTSLSSPVIASMPGSVCLRKESSEFNIKCTCKERLYLISFIYVQ